VGKACCCAWEVRRGGREGDEFFDDRFGQAMSSIRCDCGFPRFETRMLRLVRCGTSCALDRASRATRMGVV